MAIEPNIDTSEPRIPVICMYPSSMPAFQLFNPNDWQRESRAVILSCSTEFSVLQYGVDRISEICGSSKERCQLHFETLKRQQGDAKAILLKTICYGQDPELHLLIEAFFSGIKSLLDLIVQLISTEKIVGAKLNGFHRSGKVYGGGVLSTLDRNSCADKRDVAKRLKALIIKHKQQWIDEVISSRDLLIHPTKGAHLVMFEIRLTTRDGLLVFEDAVSPSVGNQTIDHYSAEQLENTKQFIQAFISLLKVNDNAA